MTLMPQVRKQKGSRMIPHAKRVEFCLKLPTVAMCISCGKTLNLESITIMVTLLEFYSRYIVLMHGEIWHKPWFCVLKANWHFC